MKKTVQYFTDDYLEYCKALTPLQIVEFLENYRTLFYAASSQNSLKNKSRLISLKIPEDLLAAFRFKADGEKTAYQTQIKKLMKEWALK